MKNQNSTEKQTEVITSVLSVHPLNFKLSSLIIMFTGLIHSYSFRGLFIPGAFIFGSKVEIRDLSCYLNTMDNNIYKTRMTLLAKIRDKHDDAAWADFAYYYRKYIYNIARRMQLSHDGAEEVVQIVMIQSWNKLPEFQYDPSKGRFRGWLCRVTGNAVKNYYRDNINRFVELDPDFAFSEDLITQPEVEKIAEEEWKEYLPKLAWKNVQDNFDENVKQVWEMSKKGIDVAKIAKTVGIAESSVYVYRKRVQDKLRAEIKQLEFDLG